MPSPMASLATVIPTGELIHSATNGYNEVGLPLPKPITPRVLPLTSTPTSLLLSHFPALRLAQASGTFLAVASSSAMVCSAAAPILPDGELTTIMPNLVAASTSTGLSH